ncbi:hypothetical protein PC116_g13479 [Phytophthora cactorum]|uniref:Major facilitator superfamily domain n=1 Tax=Phytophthora cactorum TaxID=29920 RepID=A0A329S6I2_9STRA|nr:hypothetical protein PC111_g16746 [Phytophthora cactorum]KAG2810600.1 hypothetical protein PC112_g15980 [Phytophthora cactorum]KAG2901543.1 hypothetical protein PC115_g15840 [Phytophthora cactorum]KAG2917213.1 hypothetical protein PC114_g7229 [Phytophthora cactorum]KAG2952524.1 hypothetical protein PC117_g2695 [Phytophthora cactorum]
MGPFVDPSAKDLMERLSRCSLSQHEHAVEFHHDPEHAEETKITPESAFTVLGSPPHSEQRTPRQLLKAKDQSEQPIVDIWDRRWCGLVLHSIVVGVISTVLPLCVYPFLTCNLNMEGTQTLSARTLLGLPWALKPLFTLFTHCFPLPSGLRRRATMMLGWMVTAAALIAIFFQDQPTPYFQDRKMVGIPLSDLSTQQMNNINLDAPSHGAFYVMLMSVASGGYVLADVAADELSLDVATRYFSSSQSPHNEGDVFQAVMTKYRVIAMLGSFLFMGFGMSGWDYGGDFDFTLEYTQLMLLMGLLSLLLVLLLSFTLSESPRDRRSLRQSLSEIWAFVQNCGLNHVLLCRFAGGVFAGVSATAVNPIAFYYAGVQPLNDTVVSFVAIIVVLWALNWVGKKDWHVDYRVVIVAGTVVTLALDLGATMFTIWDIVRSQWFWIGLPVMEAIPSALDYTISTFVLTEVVDPSSRATVSGMVTSVSFLAGPLGLAVTKYIDAKFDVTNQDIMTDTTEVREEVMVTFFIAYGMQLISLLWLLALPKSASESRAMKSRSGTSTARAVGLLALLGLSLVFVVVVHTLSVYESTSCMGVAGGKGC